MKKVRIVIDGKVFHSMEEVPEELRPKLEKQLLDALEQEMRQPTPTPLQPASSAWLLVLLAAAGLAAYYIFFRR